MTDVGSFEKISQKDFEKLQLRVGTIKKVTQHPEKPGDYILIVDCAGADEDIQLVAGLVDAYTADELLSKQVAVLCNIEPQDVKGVESQGMILASHADKKLVLLTTDKKCPEGAKVWGIMDGERAHFEEQE